MTETQRTEYLRKESRHQERWGMEAGLKEANKSKALCYIGVKTSHLDSFYINQKINENLFHFESDNFNSRKL